MRESRSVARTFEHNYAMLCYAMQCYAMLCMLCVVCLGKLAPSRGGLPAGLELCELGVTPYLEVSLFLVEYPKILFFYTTQTIFSSLSRV